MLESRDFHAESYDVWTEHFELMTAAEERRILQRHEDLYKRLVDAISSHYQGWYQDNYAELNLTLSDWREVLWQKRPFGRHIVYTTKLQLRAEKTNASVQQDFQQWLAVREHIIARNVRLVLKVAHQHHDDHLEFADLVQEGQFGLLRALERFEAGRGWRFSTYATHWITQFIRLALKKHSRTVSIPTNVQDRLLRYHRAAAQTQQQLKRKVTNGEIAQLAQASVDDVRTVLPLGLPVASLDEKTSDSESSSTAVDFLESDAVTPEEAASREQQKRLVKRILQKLPARECLIMRMRFGIDMSQSYGYREIADQLNLSRERVRQIELETLSRLGEMGKRQAL